MEISTEQLHSENLQIVFTFFLNFIIDLELLIAYGE